MREIKFRYILKTIRTGEITTLILDMDEMEATPIEEQISTGIHVIERNEYTGLKDCKDKEIYEGDLVGIFSGMPWEVKCGCYKDHGQEHYGFYLDNTGTTQPLGMTDLNPVNMLEVIGNIYENPELLKEAKT